MNGDSLTILLAGLTGLATLSRVTEISGNLNDINVAVAEGKLSLAEGQSSWQALANLPIRMIRSYFLDPILQQFRRNDPLRNNIDSIQAREDYDKIRANYAQTAKAMWPKDRIIAAIVEGNFTDLEGELDKKGVKSMKMFQAYLEIAMMMPNEPAIWILLAELEPHQSRSKDLLNRIDPSQYTAIMSLIISPVISAGHFKHLFALYPPPRPTAFIWDVVEQMINSTPSVMIDYLAACYELSVALSFPIKQELSKIAKNIKTTMFKPRMVALAVAYLAVEQRDPKGLALVFSILNKYPVKERHKTEFLKGINSVIHHSHVLEKIAIGQIVTKVSNDLLNLILHYDPDLKLSIDNSFVAILELARQLQIISCMLPKYKFPKIDLKETFKKMPIDKKIKSRSVLGFALRTDLIPAESLMGYTSYFFLQQRVDGKTRFFTQKIVEMKALASDLDAPCQRPMSRRRKGMQRTIQVGDLTEYFRDISYQEAKEMIYSILATAFYLPISAFKCDAPLTQLDPIDHLNQRLACYCGTFQPAYVFTKQR